MNSTNGSMASLVNRKFLNAALENFKAANPGVLQQAHDTMFSDVAILITPAQMQQMRGVIAAVEKLVAMPTWQQHVLGDANQQYIPANPGVFFGYDFHLNAQGAHLIEINTNAGGAFLSALFEQSQQAASLLGKSLAQDNLQQVFVTMFKHEWSLARGAIPLHSVAIVDVAPQSQYFYPEFVLARQWLEQAGIKTFIADPADFRADAEGLYLGENKIDLVYNRLTDFPLQEYPVLLNAYKQNVLVLTPHPHAYNLYADKRNLSLLTDPDFLRSIGLDEISITTLQAGIPQTRLVEEKDKDQWWKERKDWFFKPATGYGGKGSYRGDKLTQRVFGEIMQGGYVAQRKAMPGEVMVNVDGADAAAFKYDVRCYVYEGDVQLVVARLYQGQTTNFRTQGGGFALVRVES
ncbi:MAG: hypothetical protein ACOH1I_09020 [Gallionellaceae bacterium]